MEVDDTSKGSRLGIHGVEVEMVDFLHASRYIQAEHKKEPVFKI